MSFTLNFSLTDLKDLNTFLESRSYVVGFSATATDVALFNALGKAPDAQKYPNVFRFYQHIASLTAEQKKALPAGISTGSGAAAPAAAAPAAEEDDDIDLFGDDGDAAAAKVAVAKPAPVAAPAKKEKKKAVDRTICVYEIKPFDAETDPADIEAAVRSIKMDGLSWSETFNREPIGYGIIKVLAQVIVEDDKVSFFDLEDAMLAFDDLIQSVDQLSMNKLA